MKGIKAYIRCKKAEEVIEALEDIGITGITLIDVMGVGGLADPHQSKYSVKCVEKFSEIGKLEIVCEDEKAELIINTIQKTAYTGLRGDGMIFVMPVEDAIKIRTGKRGPKTL